MVLIYKNYLSINNMFFLNKSEIISVINMDSERIGDLYW